MIVIEIIEENLIYLSFCTISKHIVQKVKDPILQLEPYLILSHDNQQLYCHKAKISRSESC